MPDVNTLINTTNTSLNNYREILDRVTTEQSQAERSITRQMRGDHIRAAGAYYGPNPYAEPVQSIEDRQKALRAANLRADERSRTLEDVSNKLRNLGPTIQQIRGSVPRDFGGHFVNLMGPSGSFRDAGRMMESMGDVRAMSLNEAAENLQLTYKSSLQDVAALTKKIDSFSRANLNTWTSVNNMKFIQNQNREVPTEEHDISEGFNQPHQTRAGYSVATRHSGSRSSNSSGEQDITTQSGKVYSRYQQQGGSQSQQHGYSRRQ
jgi:hypothetical protein